MRKTYLLILFGLFFCIKTLNAREVPGTIIFEDDTLNTILKIQGLGIGGGPNYLKIQYKIKYYDKNKMVKVLRPENAKEIRFTFKGEKIRMLSRPNRNGIGGFALTQSTHIFLKVVDLKTEGKGRLFNVYITQVGPAVMVGQGGVSPGTSTNMVKKHVIERADGQLLRVRDLSFKKDMSVFFQECPALFKKIRSKEFRKRDLEMIVEFYNENCE